MLVNLRLLQRFRYGAADRERSRPDGSSNGAAGGTPGVTRVGTAPAGTGGRRRDAFARGRPERLPFGDRRRGGSARGRTRRDVVRWGALSAAAVAVGPALVGCGPSQQQAGSAVGPTAAATKTRLIVQVSWQGAVNYGGTAAMGLRGIKWDLLPQPRWPAGSTTFIGNGLYAINRLSSNPPDLVWDLYKLINTSLGWQKLFNAQLALQPPPMLPQEGWNDWMQIVRAVAPPLANKHLEYYRDALPGAYGWAFFRYQGQQAETLWDQASQQILAGQVSAEEGLGELARRINALQQAGKVEVQAGQQAAKDFPAAGRTVAQVPTGI